MNGRILRLLIDYCRRTFGVWPLLVLAHVMQLSAFWALHVERLPLLGVVIGSLAYFVALDSPSAVLRTLPLARADVALYRWWASIGAPGLLVLACTALSWLNNGNNGWSRPAPADVLLYAAASWAALACLAVLPLSARKPKGKALGLFWAGLVALAFYGVPLIVMPRSVMTAFIALGAALGVLAHVRAWRGRFTQISVPILFAARKESGQRTSAATGSLRGWSLIIVDVARGTALLSIVAVAGVSVVRWLYPIAPMEMPVVWLFVSAVVVAACLQTRRWMQSTQSLRLLPIGHHRLTLILYAILIVPGVSACLLATGVHALVPQLGIHVPFYLLVLFLATPATVIPWQPQRYVAASAVNGVQQWAPLLQLASLPLWCGSLFAFGGPHLMPARFLGILISVAVGFIVASYFALLLGIRSSAGFQQHTGPLSAPLS